MDRIFAGAFRYSRREALGIHCRGGRSVKKTAMAHGWSRNAPPKLGKAFFLHPRIDSQDMQARSFPDGHRTLSGTRCGNPAFSL